MKKLITLSLFLLTVSALNAQITVNLSIEYQKNTDTVLKDTVVPQLCIEFKNETETPQYFVFENYEKYPKFGFATFGCPPTFEQWKQNQEKFFYIRFNDSYIVRIMNSFVDLSLKNPQITEDGETVENEAAAAFFYSAHNFLRNNRLKRINNSQKIILLEPKKSYFLIYDLTYFAVGGGEYEFIFEMKPPDKTFPETISNFQKCKEFVIKNTLKFKP